MNNFDGPPLGMMSQGLLPLSLASLCRGGAWPCTAANFNLRAGLKLVLSVNHYVFTGLDALRNGSKVSLADRYCHSTHLCHVVRLYHEYICSLRPALDGRAGNDCVVLFYFQQQMDV